MDEIKKGLETILFGAGSVLLLIALPYILIKLGDKINKYTSDRPNNIDYLRKK